jgi:hypothetical protein
MSTWRATPPCCKATSERAKACQDRHLRSERRHGVLSPEALGGSLRDNRGEPVIPMVSVLREVLQRMHYLLEVMLV